MPAYCSLILRNINQPRLTQEYAHCAELVLYTLCQVSTGGYIERWLWFRSFFFCFLFHKRLVFENSPFTFSFLSYLSRVANGSSNVPPHCCCLKIVDPPFLSFSFVLAVAPNLVIVSKFSSGSGYSQQPRFSVSLPYALIPLTGLFCVVATMWHVFRIEFYQLLIAELATAVNACAPYHLISSAACNVHHSYCCCIYLFDRIMIGLLRFRPLCCVHDI